MTCCFILGVEPRTILSKESASPEMMTSYGNLLYDYLISLLPFVYLKELGFFVKKRIAGHDS